MKYYNISIYFGTNEKLRNRIIEYLLQYKKYSEFSSESIELKALKEQIIIRIKKFG